MSDEITAKTKRQSQNEAKLSSAVGRAERAEAEISVMRAQIAREIELSDRKTSRKISMLRLIFMGIAALMGYLGFLVLINWYVPGSLDKDGIGAAFFQTSKDILLVLTGILGSAMANVFDGRSHKPDPADQQTPSED
jgi:hypothetical protein